MRAQDALSPGDSGYDYPDDDPEGIWISTTPVLEDDEDEPPPLCYYDRGPCVDRGQCMFYGCYYHGMWSYPRADPDAPDPEY